MCPFSVGVFGFFLLTLWSKAVLIKLGFYCIKLKEFMRRIAVALSQKELLRLIEVAEKEENLN